MKQEALTTIKGGLSRQRTSGGALKDALFDLLNGYVTSEKTVRSRPGTTLDATLPAGTFGLTYWNDSFHVFASSTVSGIPTGYTLNVLRAPDESAMTRIHFVEPFLGRLYVVAEFGANNIYHFWIRDGETWEADKEYLLSNVVVPVTVNGYKYTPKRNGQPFPQWTPGAERTVGDKLEPTTFNGYYFEVVSVSGPTPKSGLVEPEWLGDTEIFAGKRYYESTDGAYTPPRATPPRDRDRRPPPDDELEERYGRRRWRRNEARWQRP